MERDVALAPEAASASRRLHALALDQCDRAPDRIAVRDREGALT
jgi:hypothetical protein